MCIIFMGLLVGSPVSFAQNCKVATIPSTTPTPKNDENDRFITFSSGVVVDSTTKLMWKRCPQGLSYGLLDESSTNEVSDVCVGGVTQQVAWQDAVDQAESSSFGGYTDWRLPTIKELSSIVERQCTSPSLNINLFPTFVTDQDISYFGLAPFWSSTQTINSERAYVVEFSLGENGTSSLLAEHNSTRLVRTLDN